MDLNEHHLAQAAQSYRDRLSFVLRLTLDLFFLLASLRMSHCMPFFSFLLGRFILETGEVGTDRLRRHEYPFYFPFFSYLYFLTIYYLSRLGHIIRFIVGLGVRARFVCRLHVKV